jgi:hypothetical protein
MKDDVFALLSSKSPRMTPSKCLPISIVPILNESATNSCKITTNFVNKQFSYGLAEQSASKSFDDIELKIKLLEEQAKQFKVSEITDNDTSQIDNSLLTFNPIDKFKAVIVSSQSNDVACNQDKNNYNCFLAKPTSFRNDDPEMKKIK